MNNLYVKFIESSTFSVLLPIISQYYFDYSIFLRSDLLSEVVYLFYYQGGIINDIKEYKFELSLTEEYLNMLNGKYMKFY